MCGADFMVIPTPYHLVEQVPIGWRALKPRHLNTTQSVCAYFVKERYHRYGAQKLANQLLFGTF